jgi:uncharacterized UBP type Zn finger protein
MERTEAVRIEAPCAHAGEATIREVRRPAAGCETCLELGGRWLHLRTCLTCGRVGCCDSSPGRHASAHYRETGHPIVTSAERGETWVWCFADDEAISS